MKQSDLKRLREIEASTRETIRSHPEQMENGGFVRASVRVFHELEWLCKELRKALKGSKVEDDDEVAEPAASA